MCEKKDTAHVCSARCAINECDAHAYVHADIPNSNTRVCLARIPTFIPVHNVIVYTMHKLAPQLHTYATGYALHCTALTVMFGVWSCGQVLHQCAVLPHRLCGSSEGCTHMGVRRTCVARDARSHTYNRERGKIHLCIRACRHIKQTRVHALHVYLASFQYIT
jgi:hypothetical protein